MFLLNRPVCVLLGGFLASVIAQAQDPLSLLKRLVQDDSPRVRVEALRALAKIPTADAAAAALGVLDKPMDPTLDYALWLTINDLAEPWIAAVQSGAWPAAEHERQLEFALRALRPEQASRVLAVVLGNKALARDGSGPWIEVIGAAGAPSDLRRLFDQARQGGFDAAATVQALKALHEAARLRNQRPTGELTDLETFLRQSNEAIRLEAVRLAGRWKDIGGALTVLLEELAANAAASDAERAVIFESLRQIGGPQTIAGLGKLTAPGQEPAVRRAAATTLAGLDSLEGFRRVIDAADTLKDESTALAYWRGVLAIKDSSRSVREAIEGHDIPAEAARAGMRVAREGGRDDVELTTAFAKAGGIATDTHELEAQLIGELASKAAASGDAHRGEMIYRRSALACTTCHAIGGAGGKVGPDLTSIGASAPMDYLVESLLLPNAKIKEGYSAVIVETRDGEEVTGTLARETQQELFLRNAAGQEVSIPKASVTRREMGRLSMMPSSLLEPLSAQERLDLFAFLSKLGKPGDFDASRGGVARLWHVANVVHTDLQNNESDWFWTKPFNDNRWTSLLALANGDLPGSLIEESVKAQAWTSKVAVVLATELEQSAPGQVRFHAGPGTQVWVDGKPLAPGLDMACELAAGRHRVVVKLDPRQLPDRVRLMADGATFVLSGSSF